MSQPTVKTKKNYNLIFFCDVGLLFLLSIKSQYLNFNLSVSDKFKHSLIEFMLGANSSSLGLLLITFIPWFTSSLALEGLVHSMESKLSFAYLIKPIN